MVYEMPQRPVFLERALQGLAFWMGHRRSLFRHYPLPEGAMVAEACNLIQANLSDTLRLHPECQYKNLLPPGVQTDIFGNLTRADLVLVSHEGATTSNGANISPHVQFVIEVKRGSASKAAINQDIKRLYEFLRLTHTNARAFLIVVSESRVPSRFVSDGKSRLGTNTIPGCDGCFHVRRTVKAASSFAKKSRAHYACLLEVFHERPQKLPAI